MTGNDRLDSPEMQAIIKESLQLDKEISVAAAKKHLAERTRKLKILNMTEEEKAAEKAARMELNKQARVKLKEQIEAEELERLWNSSSEKDAVNIKDLAGIK